MPVYLRRASPFSRAGPFYLADSAHVLFPSLCLYKKMGLPRFRLEQPRSLQAGQPAFSYKHNDNFMRN